jgi:hypothetical protein
MSFPPFGLIEVKPSRGTFLGWKTLLLNRSAKFEMEDLALPCL